MNDPRGGPGLVAVAWPIAPGHDAGVPLTGVNGIEFCCEGHGTGAPLLLLAGLGRDVSEISMLAGPLAARA
jgi:hypothetical protein